MSDNVALWTTDATTIVLAQVCVAYWAVHAETANSSDAPIPFSGRWRRTLIEDSTCFVIEYTGGHSIIRVLIADGETFTQLVYRGRAWVLLARDVERVRLLL